MKGSNIFIQMYNWHEKHELYICMLIQILFLVQVVLIITVKDILLSSFPLKFT